MHKKEGFVIGGRETMKSTLKILKRFLIESIKNLPYLQTLLVH